MLLFRSAPALVPRLMPWTEKICFQKVEDIAIIYTAPGFGLSGFFSVRGTKF